eukprot:IDg3570t1
MLNGHEQREGVALKWRRTFSNTPTDRSLKYVPLSPYSCACFGAFEEIKAALDLNAQRRLSPAKKRCYGTLRILLLLQVQIHTNVQVESIWKLENSAMQ